MMVRAKGDGGGDRRPDNALDLLLVGVESDDTSQLLESVTFDGVLVEHVDDAEGVAHAVVASRPDVVIVDLRGGDRVANRILGRLCRDAGCNALAITTLADVDTRLRLLDIEGVEHLIAPFEPREGVAWVRRLLARSRAASHAYVGAGDLAVHASQRCVIRSGQSVALTPREVGVLLALIDGDGKPISKREFLETIWNGETRSENVVEANVSSLRRKLHSLGPPVIHTVHGSGYVFRSVPFRAKAARFAPAATCDPRVLDEPVTRGPRRNLSAPGVAP